MWRDPEYVDVSGFTTEAVQSRRPSPTDWGASLAYRMLLALNLNAGAFASNFS